LSDAETAYPLAVFESSLISKMRTAAVTAVAAKFLKPADPIHLGVIGYGNQAEAHIEALMCVSDVKKIRIAGRNEDKAKDFVRMVSAKKTIPLTYDTIENSCKNSNMLITCTPSTDYFVKKEWIQEGSLIGAIGADSPGKNRARS
jgi:ornithine cyclodeaminase/alanine dehydrogenase-like protein (mu-crystallin family)